MLYIYNWRNSRNQQSIDDKLFLTVYWKIFSVIKIINFNEKNELANKWKYQKQRIRVLVIWYVNTHNI